MNKILVKRLSIFDLTNIFEFINLIEDYNKDYDYDYKNITPNMNSILINN